jgi:serine/threonine protein kinase
MLFRIEGNTKRNRQGYIYLETDLNQYRAQNPQNMNQRTVSVILRNKRDKSVYLEAEFDALRSYQEFENQVENWSLIIYPELSHHYSYVRDIAEGSQGIVSIYKCIKDGELVAVKTLNNVPSRETCNVEKEIQIMREMGSSRHFIKIKKVYLDEDNKTWHIIMPWCQGNSLADLISKESKLSEERSRVVLRQILEGLSLMHDRGIVHRDLKP